MSTYASNDIPPTDAELDQFWGKEPTQAEINDAIARQSEAFDEQDIGDEHEPKEKFTHWRYKPSRPRVKIPDVRRQKI